MSLPLLVPLVTAMTTGVATASTSSPIQFAEAVHYATGSSAWGPGPAPVGTVTDDFDRDGHPDVALADFDGPGPLVMLNREDGSFADGIRVPAGRQVGSLATGDLNDDGIADLVGMNNSEVIVMVGDGTGGFAVDDRYPMSVASQQQAIVADVDSDGVLDIVAITQGGVKVLLGRGDATFADGPFTSVLGGLAAATVADFDDDPRPDLAVGDGPGGRVIALQGNGDGSFVQTGSAAAGLGVEDVRAGDFNGDGLSDVVSVDSFSFTISVLLADGAGGFEPAARYATAAGPVSAAIADFNSDGAQDIVVSGVMENAQVAHQGDGKGGFTEAGRFGVSAQPQTPVVLDADGDGHRDVAVAGSSLQLSVLRNIS